MPVVGQRAAAVVIELTGGFGPAMMAPLGTRPGGGCSWCCGPPGANRSPSTSSTCWRPSPRRPPSSSSWPVPSSGNGGSRCRPTGTASPATCTTTSSSGSSPPALSLDRLSRSLEADHPGRGRPPVSAASTSWTARSPGSGRRSSSCTRPTDLPWRCGAQLAEVVRSVTEGHELRPDLRIRHERRGPAPGSRARPRRGGPGAGHERGPARRRHRLTVTVDVTDEVEAWSPTTAAGCRRSPCAAAWPTWPTAPSGGAGG